MKYQRGKITDALTSIELKVLLDYVDGLEAVVRKLANLDQIIWSAPVSNSILRDLKNDARKALDKGKE